MQGTGARVPRVIGRYAIYGEIASGGMATVHFARLVGPSGFARTVAIKRAHPHLARDPDFALMFLDEARLASRIRHPNVVSTIDVLQTPSDLVLVMDYVHGESLWKLVRAGGAKNERVPAGIAATILIDTLHGLHAAHEARDERGEPLGIVHRDVSPQNILVGVDGITRLVDFGIAKAAGRLHSTKDSSVKGKYAYMAPEQARGEPVSRLTDTYAAAIVFWELLTGERLFVGKTDAETIHKCLVGRVQAPSLLAPELGTTLDEVLKKGLSRDPSRRYQTAREMALDIEACVPAIRPSEVGAWVEQVAGAALVARGEVLARMEHEHSGDTPALLRESVPVIEGVEQTVTVAHLRPEPTPGPAKTIDPVPATAEPARSRRAVALVLLLGAAIGIAGGALLVSRRPEPSAPAPRVETTSIPAPSSSAPAPPTTGAPSAPPVASAALSESIPRPSARPSTPPPARSSPRSGRPPARPVRRRTSCDPPYSIDSAGRQIFKPECM